MYQVPAYFLNQISRGATPMPRPKSELTGVGTNIAVRLIPAHYEEWKRLGGPKWLRQELSNKIKERRDVQKPQAS
jgi:hypothetical protein